MKAIRQLVTLGCLLFGAAAYAQSLNLLATLPLSNFSEADNKLFVAAVDKALVEGRDGVAMVWKNERSPAAGIVTPQKSYVSGGAKCRDLLIANTYKTLRSEAVHTFCETSSGQWKLVQ